MNKTLRITVIAILGLALIFSFAYSKSNLAWLGVLTQTVDNEIAEAFNLKVNYGAVINQVVKDSPAEKAGFQENDVIIKINDDQIDDTEDLINYIHDSEIGAKLAITLMRGDDKITKDVILDERSETEYKRQIIKKLPRIMMHDDDHDYGDYDFDFDWDDFNRSNYIGILISDISNQLRAFFGVKEDVGVLIGQVNEDTPAEKAGLKAGDVIISVDDNEVSTNLDVIKIINKKEVGDKVKVTVIRDKKQKSFMVDVAQLDDEQDNSFKYYAPKFDGKIPKMKFKKYSNFSDYWSDSDDFKSCIKKFKFEMQDLKNELKNLDKEQIIEIEKVLDELRENLKELHEDLEE